MTDIRDDFLSMARVAAGLLRESAVATAWDRPSSLPEFAVGGLAGHLAYQVLAVPGILGTPAPREPVVSLLEHYARVEWAGAALDADINVRIRRSGEREAAEGPEALAARADAAVGELTARLPAEPDRAVRIPFWGPWSLTLDDLLVTRMMELAVHCDDLAVGVGVPTPRFPDGALARVLGLLSAPAVRRHGQSAVLRAFSRAERAPDGIAAF
ncbi:maleylpyruvate isomerase N-terminal domain-containing protein [Streptomyces sp. NPDC037389]|uniref:maleylpyruvate isomerase N-terminal domain-containing protein n=1 Tax=Streptomyces sp. NPDC037389 TaxID=3155369 RepID=UPI0033F7CA61